MNEILVEVSTDELREGQILGKPIYLNSSKSAVYLPKDYLLEANDISWLKNKGISKVSILNELGDLEIILNNEFPKLFQQDSKSEFIFTDYIQGLVKKCLNQITFEDARYLRGLKKFKSADYSTFFHVLDVMSLNIALGKFANFDDDELFIAAKCGLLHDVGKYRKDISKIISSEGGLTVKQRNVMQEHSGAGYDLIEKFFSGEIEAMQVAGGHHFFSNGNERKVIGGYGDKRITNLNKYILMTRISDVYGALTSMRPQGKLMYHEEAIEKMNKIHANEHFDNELFEIFKALSIGKKRNLNVRIQ